MNDSILAYIFFLYCCFLIPSCHSHNDHDHDAEDTHQHDETEGTDDHEDEHEDEVHFTPIQLEKIGLKLGLIEKKNIKSTLQVSGHLELPPQNKASVSAMAEGVVNKIYVNPGQFVNKGSRLLNIQHPDFIGWQQQYLEAQGKLSFLTKEFERQKNLVEQEVAAKKQFEKISSEKAIEEARLKAMKARLELLGIPLPTATSDLITGIMVRSPIGGFVRTVSTNTGAFIEPGQELFEIVDNHHIHIDFLIYEKDINFIKVGQKINFILQNKPEEVMEAKVFAIGKALEEEQRGLKVHAELDNEKGTLLPGMYVEGRIILEDNTVDALPEEAITIDKGLKYIFIKDHEEEAETTFKKVQVLTGPSDLGYVNVTVLEEIKKEAQIVIEGAYFLMAQTKIGEGGGGHDHAH